MTYKYEYDYTTGSLPSYNKRTRYIYDYYWKDRIDRIEERININGNYVTSYRDLSYDLSGNIIDDELRTYEWEGRELTHITDIVTGDEVEYRYNDSGYRTYKKVMTDTDDYYYEY